MPKTTNEKKSVAQILPNNMDAELGVLGSALLSEDACLGIVSKLKADDFYSEVNQKIFEAMESLYKKNIVVDYITLTDELESMNALNSVGGAEFIMSLSNVVPSAVRWTQYADIVKRCAINRKLIFAAQYAMICPKGVNNYVICRMSFVRQ